MVFLALLPIIWLVIGLGFLKIPGYKACPIAAVIAAVIAVYAFDMPALNAGTAALEGVALAVWPILLVIVAAIFAYNLTVYTKSMDVIKQMLTTVSNDKRILAVLIGWGFGAFMEGMAGFGKDRKSGVLGKSVDLGGGRIIKKKNIGRGWVV